MLVVDDDQDAVQLLTRMVLACGLQVTAVCSPLKRLTRCGRTRRTSYAAEHRHARHGRLGGAGIMRQDDRWRDIPVVVVSAQDAQDEPLVSGAFLATMGVGSR